MQKFQIRKTNYEDIKCVAFGIIDYSTKETDRVLGKTLGKLLSKELSLRSALSVKTRADLIFSDVFHSLIGAQLVIKNVKAKEFNNIRLQQN